MVKISQDFLAQRNRIKENLSIELDKANATIAKIVENAGHFVLDESIPITPLDTGALRQSARVFVGTKKLSDKGFKITATVSYGGNVRVTPTKNAPNGIVTYATYVHEDLTVDHAIGQAKFLEEGARRAQPKINQYIDTQLNNLRNGRPVNI